MFDGNVPVELERLKEIYRAVDHLSNNLAAFADDARREGLPKPVQERIESLEEEADNIEELFEGVLTDDEQFELLTSKASPDRDPWNYDD